MSSYCPRPNCYRLTRKTRNPLALACFSTDPQPWSASHTARESAPRLRCTTSHAVPPGASRGSHEPSSSCSAALPMRIGGFDQMVSKRASAATASGAMTATRSATPAVTALREARSSARSLTSTAVTVTSGDVSAAARAIGPHPQPRSSTWPTGAGTVRSSTWVPRSTCAGEKIPGATSSVSSRPARVTVMRRRSSGEAGRALK